MSHKKQIGASAEYLDSTLHFDSTEVSASTNLTWRLGGFPSIGRHFAIDETVVFHPSLNVLIWFDSGIGRSELPVGSQGCFVALVFPFRHVLIHVCRGIKTAIDALARQDAQLHLCHVEPTAVAWCVNDAKLRESRWAVSAANVVSKLAMSCVLSEVGSAVRTEITLRDSDGILKLSRDLFVHFPNSDRKHLFQPNDEKRQMVRTADPTSLKNRVFDLKLIADR